MQTSSALLPHHCLAEGLRWSCLSARTQNHGYKIKQESRCRVIWSRSWLFNFFMKLTKSTNFNNFCLHENIYCSGDEWLTASIAKRGFEPFLWNAMSLSTSIYAHFSLTWVQQNTFLCINSLKVGWFQPSLTYLTVSQNIKGVILVLSTPLTKIIWSVLNQLWQKIGIFISDDQEMGWTKQRLE